VSAFGYSGTIANVVVLLASEIHASEGGPTPSLAYARRPFAWWGGVRSVVPRPSHFLGAGEVPAFLSTFASKAENARMVGAGTASAACSVSLEAVLDLVQRTAGGSVNADAPLMEAGVDSLGAVELRNQLQGAAGRTSLPSTLVFDHPTARQLASVLQPEQSARASATLSASAFTPTGADVGIDGMSALLPSGVSSLALARFAVGCGRDTIMQVPAARWDVNEHLALLDSVASRVRHAGFVYGAELADNAAFAVSPAETAAMDPCQRLVLEFGYAALHDAPLDRTALGGSLTGIFLALSDREFAHMLRASPAGGSVYAATGSTASIAAGRLSYILGLHGPCVSYDTACSGSLVACNAGMRALQLAECTAGTVIGVQLILAPLISSSIAVAGMTSVRGRSHTFDQRADGYARSEACGGISMHSTESLEVTVGLLGSAVRQDGRSASLTAPNGQAQLGLLVAALQDAGTPVAMLALNEAHGTGTALGDPIEAGSLAAAVLSAREEALAVGGVKANIGHAEPAAGMTGLLKLAIGLRAGEAAPNAQLRALNPHVGGTLGGVPCALQEQLAVAKVGCGGVSSFGYAGTISHGILCNNGKADAAPVMPLMYRRRAFPWRQELSATSDVPCTSTYMVSWSTAASPSSLVAQDTWLCLAQPALLEDKVGLLVNAHPDAHEPMPLGMATTVLLTGASIVAPSTHALQLLLDVAMCVARQTQPLGLRLVTCTTQTQRTSCVTFSHAAYGGYLGFSRVLRVEHPSLPFLCAELANGAAGHSAMQRCATFSSYWMQELHVLIQSAHMPTLRRASTSFDERQDTSAGEDLITGGLGGLGLSVGAWLLRGRCSHLVLTSRSGQVAHEGQGLNYMLARLLRLGGTTLKICDGAEKSQVAPLLESLPHVCRVMHLPHVHKYRLVRSMEADDLPHTFTAKAIGASNLHGALSKLHLDSALLFSSNATYGGATVAAHAAANTYLDANARGARAAGLQRHALVVPTILDVGAGAAIGNAGTNTPEVLAVTLTAGQLLHSIHLAVTGAAPSVCCGPLKRNLSALAHGTLPLTWLLREQHAESAPAATALTRNLSVDARVSAARAAACALDAAMVNADETAMPSDCEVIIVGAGITGLSMAAAFVEVGAQLVVLEARATVGGVWRAYGNPHSRVNSTEPTYRMRVTGRERLNTDHSYYFEMLDDIRRIVIENRLAKRLQLGAMITAAGRDVGGVLFAAGAQQHHSRSPAARFELHATRHILLATNRRLGAPRLLEYEGKDAFRGLVRRGLRGDNVGLAWKGARVLVLGHGPYAVEQVRTALEHAARHVQLLVRRHGLVCPAIVDYLNLVRPFTNEFEHPKAGSGLMVGMWQTAYARARATPPETWQRGIFRPDGHSVSVSDLYFVGHHAERIGSEVGETRRFVEAGIQTASGTFYAADLVLQCIGFQINEGNERLLGRARLGADGTVDPGLSAMFEHHLDERANLLPLTSQLNGINFAVKQIIWSWQQQPADAMRSMQHPRVRINHINASEASEALMRAVAEDPHLHAMLMEHVCGTTDDTHASWTPEEYLDCNQRQWDALGQQLATMSGKERMQYPFPKALQVLEMEAPASLRSSAL
jgi:3-oxoacyl-(acyl-carrier-protein) synthase